MGSKVRCGDGLPGMRAMVTSQTEGRDEQGCRQVGRCHLVACGHFLIRVSAFSVKEEIGSSAENEDGKKMLRRDKQSGKIDNLLTFLSLVPT